MEMIPTEKGSVPIGATLKSLHVLRNTFTQVAFYLLFSDSAAAAIQAWENMNTRTLNQYDNLRYLTPS